MSLEAYLQRDGVNLDELIAALISRRHLLEPRHIGKILPFAQVLGHDLGAMAGSEGSVGSGEHTVQQLGVDLIQEARLNLAAAKALRSSYFGDDENPQLPIGRFGKDGKDALVAATNILEIVRKQYESLNTLATHAAIEQALVETMEDMGMREEFLAKLGPRMADIP